MSEKFESALILNALKSGVAPLRSVDKVIVDRREIKEKLEKIFNSNSLQHVIFIADFFGNGKTLFSHYALSEALKKNFLISKLALSRGINLQVLESVYSNVICHISHQGKNFEPSFNEIIDNWIKITDDTDIKSLIDQLKKISEGFSAGLSHYVKSYKNGNILEQYRGLQHLTGTKAVYVSLKKEDAIPDKLTTLNVHQYFFALDYFIKKIGYTGLLIVFDEVESILNLVNKNIRNKAYSNIVFFCENVNNNTFKNTIFIFMLTPDLRDNKEKGITTYKPLETYITQKYNAYNNISTLKLYDGNKDGLALTDQIDLAKKIRLLHEKAYNWSPHEKLDDNFINDYTEYFNRPNIMGSANTIRLYVRQFLDLLDVTNQNQDFDPKNYLQKLINRNV